MKRALWVAFLAGFVILGLVRGVSAEPLPNGAGVQYRLVVGCSRPPQVPSSFFVWVRDPSGAIWWGDPLLFLSTIPTGSDLVEYKPMDPVCRSKPAAAKSPAAAAPAAPPAPAKAPPTVEVSKKKAEAPKVEKPKAQEEPKRQSVTTPDEQRKKVEEALREERRRRAREARKTAPPPRHAAISATELLRKRDEEAEAKGELPTIRRSFEAKPMQSSACPVCGTVTPASQQSAAALFRCRPVMAPVSPVFGYLTPAGTARVRESITQELDEYKRAQSGPNKQKHGQKLRDLFTSIAPSLAQEFRAMLETRNDLAVMFRQVLKDDPLRKELIDILEQKYICTPIAAPPTPPASSLQGPFGSQSQALPPTSTTSKAAFKELDNAIGERLLGLLEKGETLHRLISMDFKKTHLKLVSQLDHLWRQAKRRAAEALQETDSAKRLALLKNAGDRYEGLLVATEVAILRLNAELVIETGDEAAESTNVLGALATAFEPDEATIALLQAAFDADVPAMERAYPAWNKRYEGYEAGLNALIARLGTSAELSKKVVKVADIVMIAISIYQVAKMPVIPSGGSWTPPAILGTLPGGVALSAGADLARLSSTLAAIQQLVQIGALDGAAIAGLSTLGGRAKLTLPELQRPTSLAVQSNNPPGGSGNSGSGNGGPPTPTANDGPVHHLMTNKNEVSAVSGGPWTPQFRDMAQRAGMTLEDAANKVSIPGHHGPHPQAYHAEVFRRLTSATKGLSGAPYSAAFRSQLALIRTEAATPGTQLNFLLTGH